MLNLSDNELDRLSREAASQHDPGDLTGPQAWERLQVRLDKELGRAGPDVSRGLRGIRRLPFQYAPVILLIVGVSYYFVKHSKGRKAEGSPPLTVVKTPQQPGTTASDSSLNNSAYSKKSTSTPYPGDQSQNIDSASAGVTSSGTASTSSGSTTPLPGANAASSGSNTAAKPPSSGSNPSSPGSFPPSSATNSLARNRTTPGDKSSPGTRNPSGLKNTPGAFTGTSSNKTGAFTRSHRNHTPANGRNNGNTHQPADLSAGTTGTPTGLHTEIAPAEAGPEWSFVQRPRSLRTHPYISDSALRAYTAQTPANPGPKSGPSLKINRSLSFGFVIAPDFSSVNALAGDKPGSSFGLTIDYQFADRLHIGAGLLFSRKNYTARRTDFHEPPGYYQMVGLKGVDFVKGSMNMLEIPLSLRYDFSITGNTIFFASGGLSTYLFGKENSNYYYFNTLFGREMCRTFDYNNKQSFFSTANISLGVETGISNSLSVQVAPYMKLPVSDLGFGKIRMNSVGISVGIRYSPVISRKRQH